MIFIIAETHDPDDFSDRPISFSSPTKPTGRNSEELLESSLHIRTTPVFSDSVKRTRTNSEELLDMIEIYPASRRVRATPVFSDSDDESPDCIPIPFSFTDAANTFIKPSPSPPPIDTEFVIDLTSAAAAWESAEGRTSLSNDEEALAAPDRTEWELMAISQLHGLFDADDEADVDVLSALSVTQSLLTDVAAMFDSENETTEPCMRNNVTESADELFLRPVNITELGGLYGSDDDTTASSLMGQGPYTSSSFAQIPAGDI